MTRSSLDKLFRDISLDPALTGGTYKVLVGVVGRLDSDGVVSITPDALADLMRIQRSTVSRAFAQLVMTGVLSKSSAGIYTFRPQDYLPPYIPPIPLELSEEEQLSLL